MRKLLKKQGFAPDVLVTDKLRWLGGRSFKDGDKTFLYTEAFDQMDTAEVVTRAAEALIATINASLRLSHAAARPLRVERIVNAHGAGFQFPIIKETFHARCRMEAVTVVVDGDQIIQPERAEPVIAKRARLIDSDPDVARAVKFLIEPDETFGSLWGSGAKRGCGAYSAAN